MKSRIEHCSMVTIILVAACGAGTAGVDRASLFLSAAPAPEGRDCHVAGNPAALPAADAVIDSAAVVNAVRLQAGDQAGYTLLSLQFDNQGHLASRHTIETNLPSERGTAVEVQTVNRVRAQPPGAPWSIRLKVSSDTVPHVQVGRSEFCPAVIRGPMHIVVSGRVLSGGGRSRGAPPSASTSGTNFTSPHFLVLVDSAGRLVDLKLTQTSGESSVDEQLESGLRQQGFLPSLLDGVPVLAWTPWPPPEH